MVKIFSREEPELCTNEAQFLRLLYGKLTVPTPRLFSTGIHDGYPYIIMEEIDGLPLKTRWKHLSRRDREKVVGQSAIMLKALHSIPADGVTFTETGWDQLMENQKKNLAENHRGFGLDENRVTEILRFIETTEPVEDTRERVICHTEIMREHLFIKRTRGEVRISGLIDFEPSMVAIPEYDLCSVGLFLTAGEKGLFRHFLEVYGYREGREAVMRMLLLHRYSNMKWFISTLPEEIQSEPLESLSDYWYG